MRIAEGEAAAWVRRTPLLRRVSQRWSEEVRFLPRQAEVYRPLGDPALIFDRIDLGVAEPAVSLLLPSIRPNLSAGPMTAIDLAARLADLLRRPMRIVTTSWAGGASDSMQEELRARLAGVRLQFSHVGDGRPLFASIDDLWIATAWETAFSADVAARVGHLDRSKVIYLVQDFEPGFFPWSTSYATAQSTYHAGFVLVVNSSTLADYLRQQEAVEVDADLVLGPALDLPQLRSIAEARAADSHDVFFYARPTVAPRNMYDLGLAAARFAASTTERRWRLVVAGEDMARPTVPGIEVEVAGRTSHSGYFEIMQRTKVALSLMLSPHPSHPVLDWAVSGGWTVTNRFDEARDDLHPRVIAVAAHPEAVGRALASAIDGKAVGPFIPPRPLGRSLDQVASALATRMQDDVLGIERGTSRAG